MSQTKNCIWCNENDKEALAELRMDMPIQMGYSRAHDNLLIHEECEADFKHFVEMVDRYSGFFTGMMMASFMLVVLLLVVTLAFSRFAGLTGLGALCITSGFLIFYLPFATPLIVKSIGLKKSKYLVRLFSITVIGLGGAIIYLAF